MTEGTDPSDLVTREEVEELAEQIARFRNRAGTPEEVAIADDLVRQVDGLLARVAPVPW